MGFRYRLFGQCMQKLITKFDWTLLMSIGYLLELVGMGEELSSILGPLA